MQNNKKVFVLAPILPDWNHVNLIEKVVNLLLGSEENILNIIDPLSCLENDAKIFYPWWLRKLEKEINNYDVFLGFSFGGVILQQCFSLFENINRKIILFSTPSFINFALYQKLNKIIQLIKLGLVEDALALHDKWVFSPNAVPYQIKEPVSSAAVENIISRVLHGLNLILKTDSREKLKNTSIQYTHLIGEKSVLVNHQNVVVSTHGKLIIVPNAGMRVLQDNFPYCQQILREIL